MKLFGRLFMLPALVAGLAVGAGALAQSGGALDCVSKMATRACAQAEAGLGRAFDASLSSTTNNPAADVSEVHGDVGAGVSVTFADSAGTSFAPGASPGRLPDGSTAGLASAFALDPGTRGALVSGIPAGGTAVGAHARSLLDGRSESATTSRAVAEPRTDMLMLAVLGVVGLVARRLRSS